MDEMEGVCTGCKQPDYLYLVHVDEKKPERLCIKCAGNPEYLVDCPHCAAQIAVN